MDLHFLAALIMVLNIVETWVLLQFDVLVLGYFSTNLVLKLLGQDFRVLVLNLLPLVDLAWIVSFDEPRVLAMVFVEVLLLVFLE